MYWFNGMMMIFMAHHFALYPVENLVRYISIILITLNKRKRSD